MKKTETRRPQETLPRAKAALPKKASVKQSKAAPKRGGGGPSTAAELSSDSEWIVGPYGNLMSKKDLGLLVTSRTRVS